MAIKKIEAIELVQRAIESGRVLQCRAYSGDGVVTCGPYREAVPRNGSPRFAGFWYKRGGEDTINTSGCVAEWFVERVGRGAAGRIARLN